MVEFSDNILQFKRYSIACLGQQGWKALAEMEEICGERKWEKW